MKNTGLKQVLFFSFDFNVIDTNDLLDIQKYLIKKYNIKNCLGWLRKCLLDC